MLMNVLRFAVCVAAAALPTIQLPAIAADPWADAVISYQQGTNPASGFTTAAAALGEPTRFTAPASPFGGVVTPSNSPFGAGEIVSIGEGGSLVLRFDEPVTNDPQNPFGVDLLVFGNSFVLGNLSNPMATATGVASEGGVVEVSNDGLDWRLVPGAADGLFPTNGYADITQPFTSTPGAVPSDFTRPVDPSFNLVGKTFAQLIAGYGGSGGGLGVDIGPTGLSSIQYVRITNPMGSGATPEIDALADVRAVPEPAAVTTFLLAAGLIAWQNRRRG
jgi:hypothetical protein